MSSRAAQGCQRRESAEGGTQKGRELLGGLRLSASSLPLVVLHKPKQELIWVQRAG